LPLSPYEIVSSSPVLGQQACKHKGQTTLLVKQLWPGRGDDMNTEKFGLDSL
jgi:hypothetical protein